MTDRTSRDEIARILRETYDREFDGVWGEWTAMADALFAADLVKGLTWDDLCANCGHAPKNHAPSLGCTQVIGYSGVGGTIGKRAMPCPCSGFKRNGGEG